VTIYTDGVHLIDSTSTLDDLHVFAAKVGLRRSWFQGDHYDLTTRNAAARAVAAGAVLIDMRDLGRLNMRLRRQQAKSSSESSVPHFAYYWLEPDWAPTPLDPSAAADCNTRLMKMFAPGRRVGRRGVDHLTPDRPPRDARP